MPTPFRSLLFALPVMLALALPSAALEQWLYCSQNLWVDKNSDELEALFQRAGKAGYTHVLLADSKFAKLGDMDARYFRNVERVKKISAAAHLEIVPAVFPIGYSNDILWHDPNLIEALPVREALFVVKGGEARLQADAASALKGGDFSELKLWGWHDPTVVADNGAVLIRDPKGENARISQKVKLTPFRQYHITVRVRTQEFRGTPEVKLIASGHVLNYNALGVKPTQDWTTHRVVFNSLSNTEAQIYFGCWGGRSGSLWFDDAKLDEVGLVPNHNAHKDYYLVRGDLTGSWEGLDKDVIIVPWYFEKRAASLKFFADRGHHQVIAGYYDHKPEQIADWMRVAKPFPGVDDVMYTTWHREYKDMERFAEVVRQAAP